MAKKRNISEELKASRKIQDFPYLEPYMDKQNREEFEEFILQFADWYQKNTVDKLHVV